MADTYGRKKLLIAGALLLSISSIFITLSTSIGVFLFYRLLQGVAVASIATVSRAILPDVFEGQAYHKVVNITTIAWSLGPIVSPYVGGYLQNAFGWRSCFYVLSAYAGILLVFILFMLPETPSRRQSFALDALLSRYRIILTSRIFLGGAIICGLVHSFIQAFNTMAPFLLQSTLHMSALNYGKVSLCMGGSFFVGNLCNRLLLNIKPMRRMAGAIMVILLSALLDLYFLSQAQVTVMSIVFPSLLIVGASGVLFPIAYGAALQQRPEFSGTVSSLMTLIFVLTASVASAVSSELRTENQVSYILFIMLIIGLLTLTYKGLLGSFNHS